MTFTANDAKTRKNQWILKRTRNKDISLQIFFKKPKIYCLYVFFFYFFLTKTKKKMLILIMLMFVPFPNQL